MTDSNAAPPGTRPATRYAYVRVSSSQLCPSASLK